MTDFHIATSSFLVGYATCWASVSFAKWYMGRKW